MKKFTMIKKKMIIDKKKQDIELSRQKRNKSLEPFDEHLKRIMELKKIVYGADYIKRKRKSKLLKEASQ